MLTCSYWVACSCFRLENVSCRCCALHSMEYTQVDRPQRLASPSGESSSSHIPHDGHMVALGCTSHHWWHESRRSPFIPLLTWGCLRWAWCVHGEKRQLSISEAKDVWWPLLYLLSGPRIVALPTLPHWLEGWLCLGVLFLVLPLSRKVCVCLGCVGNKPLCVATHRWTCFFLSVGRG